MTLSRKIILGTFGFLALPLVGALASSTAFADMPDAGNVFATGPTGTPPKVTGILYNGITVIPLETLQKMEDVAFDLMNQFRVQNGASVLKFSSTLQAIARSHSEDEAKNNIFDHTGSNGDSAAARIQHGKPCGPGHCVVVGENIHLVGYPSAQYAINDLQNEANAMEVAKEMATELFNHPGHHENALQPFWEMMAIGFALGDDGSLYLTQDFARANAVPKGMKSIPMPPHAEDGSAANQVSGTQGEVTTVTTITSTDEGHVTTTTTTTTTTESGVNLNPSPTPAAN